MNDYDVLIYTSYLHIIGGIETFIVNFIDLLKNDYKIGVLCPKLPEDMRQILSRRADVLQNNTEIRCKTLVMVRMMDNMPHNVTYEKSVRMCHATKSNPTWAIKQDCDMVVHVSEASRTSFNSDGDIIHNPLIKNPEKALLLVSATRVPALDKGKNAERMLKLAEMFANAKINFIWLNFSDAPLKNAPKGFINVGTYHDLQPYIEKADYLVQLSDQEGFGYSVLEALIHKTAVLCTPFSTTKELGVLDGLNGYILPFDMNFDVKKLLNVPKFEYEWDNARIKAQWDKIFSEKTKYNPNKLVNVRVIKEYRDLELNRVLKNGTRLQMRERRAKYVKDLGFIEIMR